MSKEIRKPIGIVDIAEYLGMSKATVSHVLSGQAEKRRVAKRTAELVRETAEKLGYIPNRMARNLRQQRSGTISTLFYSLSMDWAQGIMEGVTPILESRHYTPLIGVYARSFECQFPSYRMDPDLLGRIMQRRDEAVLCHPIMGAKEDYLKLIKNGIPTVFMAALLEDMSGLEDVSSVIWDCGAAVRTLVQYLASTGRKKIAFVGCQHMLESDQIRYNSFLEALEDANLPFQKNWDVWGGAYQLPTLEQILELMGGANEKPDAIVAIDDSTAISVLNSLEELGFKVPQDVAVVGMGDLPLARAYGLTTVKEPLYRIGQEAAEVVVDMIGKPHKTNRRSIECNEIQIRRSTA